MIAISYRRDDSLPIAGRLYDRLQAKFGKRNVFMDFDSIPPGVDFRDQIKQTIERSTVLIAVIGPNWQGRRPDASCRIDDPNDFVHLEILFALNHDVMIIPVLVNNASMPNSGKLPPDIQELAFRHALSLDSGMDFHAHVDRLINSIKRAGSITANFREEIIAREIIGAPTRLMQPRDWTFVDKVLSKRKIIIWTAAVLFLSVSLIMWFEKAPKVKTQELSSTSKPSSAPTNAPSPLPASSVTPNIAVSLPPSSATSSVYPSITEYAGSSSSLAWLGELFPETRIRQLTAKDVSAWDADKLRYAINEMYARGGYDFRTPQIKQIFLRLPWYRDRLVNGRTQDEAYTHLPTLERTNLELLQAVRRGKQ